MFTRIEGSISADEVRSLAVPCPHYRNTGSAASANLGARNESLTSEALPKRWVELLHHLDALEKRKSHPELSDPVSSMGGSNSPDMSGSDEQSR